MPMKDISKGQPITAAWLNEVVRELRRVMTITGSGGIEVTSTGSGYCIRGSGQGGGSCPKRNTKQYLTLFGPPEGGNFTLTLHGDTTSNIAYNANAATIKAAIEALDDVGAGNVQVTGSLPLGTVTIEFIEDLEETDVPQMTATWNLTGVGVAAIIQTQAGADGTFPPE